MRFRLQRGWLVLLPLPLFVGCASFRAGFNETINKEASEQYQSVDRHSSYPVLRRENFEQVNLLELIDPHRQSAPAGVKDWNEHDKINYGRQYDTTLAWFRDTKIPSNDEKALIRDDVQDKILAVSTSRCNVYKTFLRRQQADVNFSLGALTTVSGVLGALLPGARAASNLAGTAGIFSGIQAEYNQAYYSNLAAHVIVQAIELRQNRLKKELMEGRRDKSIQAYSMGAAINDALVVDGSCSALAGLMEAQDSIKEVETPGLRMAARAMTSAKALQEINARPISELQANGSLDRLLAVAAGNVPSLLVTSGKPSTGPLGIELQGAANVGDVARQHVALQGKVVGQAFDALQQKVAVEQRSPLKPADVAKAFNDVAAAKLGLQASPPGEPFNTCAAQLKLAAADFAAKTSDVGVVQGNGVEVSKATYARDVAEARVRLVLTQISAVKSATQAQIDAAATAAVTNLPAADKLKPFDTAALTQAFANLTLDAQKINESVNCKPQ